MSKIRKKRSLTFDDVLLVPAFSKVDPKKVNVKTMLTKGIKMNIPICSAAMDTVTEAEFAIALAQEGGIGFIHKNMTIEEQAIMVAKVKRSESYLIINPITVSPNQKVGEAREIMREHRISGLPVAEKEILVGILTARDLRFHDDNEVLVKEVMTDRSKLVTAGPNIKKKEAVRLLHENRIEKLPIVTDRDKIFGLITVKDIQKGLDFPHACKDSDARLRVGAAVGVGENALKRTKALIEAGVDVVVIDTAHGHSENVLETIQAVRGAWKDKIQLIAGNVATAEGARALIAEGVDAIKVGVGPGSICTTRVIAGIGVPQITAIIDAASVSNVPVIADGGIKYSGEITKAIAAGASSVMIGSLFAGTKESPGETILHQGKTYKVYRGMGSIGAMKKGSSDRYSQEGLSDDKFVPEGIEGQVPYKGVLSVNVFQMVGGLRAGMGYCGCQTIPELIEKGQFTRITNAGLRESHPHDVQITKESPNYQTGGGE